MTDCLQPSRVMSKSGRWVSSPTAQAGQSQPHSFFKRPSKLVASPLASQQPSNGQGPISAGWNNSSSPSTSAGKARPTQHAQHGSNGGVMPNTSSAPVAAAQAPGRWQGFTKVFRPRPQPHRHGSGPLLANTDPAVLSSIAESDADSGVVDASLHAYQSTDLDAATAAASANQLWALSSPSLSPRRSASASQGSNGQPGPSQGSYIAPSPWSTPLKPTQSSSASPSPGAYPVPSPQNTPLGTTPQSKVQTSPAAVGPFEAAARARAAQGQARAPGNSPGVSTSSSNAVQSSSAQAAYPVPSPSTSAGQQPGSASGSREGSPARSLSRAASQSRSGTNRQLVRNTSGDWSTGIAGMGTTKAARSSSGNESRRRRL